jgi:tRNA pseudouridine55 synthase
LNGLLLINKPEGLTSHDVVARVRRFMQTKEVGHSGTLDPMASGLMVLLIGEATKLSSFVTEGDKSYELGLKLGITTDTLDVTGKVLTEKTIQQSEAEIIEAALGLSGEMNLPVPMYSAKKIDGKKLYEYAREDIEVEVPLKKMKFWDIEFLLQPKSLNFSLSCSKGSFIRSWAKLLGENLGCGAALSSLKRTKSHVYELKDSITLEELESLTSDQKKARLVPLDEALVGVKRIRVKGQDAVLMKNGQISHQLRVQLISQFDPEVDQYIQILPEKKGGLLAVIGLEKDQGFKIKRVFNC